MTHPPKSLQSVLWSTNVDRLDIDKDKEYIIHQILVYGTMDELKWMFRVYGKEIIKDVFIHHPAKMYTAKTYYFTKNFLLELSKRDLDRENYVTSIFGPIRPRAAGRV